MGPVKVGAAAGLEGAGAGALALDWGLEIVLAGMLLDGFFVSVWVFFWGGSFWRFEWGEMGLTR